MPDERAVDGSPYECAFGKETGRTFIYDDLACEVVATEPEHDEWHRWTEFKAEDGSMTYVSDDPDGYWLDAEEFGPIPEDDDEQRPPYGGEDDEQIPPY